MMRVPICTRSTNQHPSRVKRDLPLAAQRFTLVKVDTAAMEHTNCTEEQKEGIVSR